MANEMFRYLALAVAFFLVQPSNITADEPSFSTNSPEIAPGASATLTWQWKHATEGWLSSVGLLTNAAGGSVVVQPTETTDYVLTLEGADTPPKLLSLRISVRGAKGSLSDWPRDPTLPLGAEYRYTFTKVSLPKLSDRVWKVLQDARHFEVKSLPLDPKQAVIIYTAFAQRDLVNQEERPKRNYRIAYRVMLSSLDTHNGITMYISATIEWRLLIDQRWFQLAPDSTDLYSKQITALKTELEHD